MRKKLITICTAASLSVIAVGSLLMKNSFNSFGAIGEGATGRFTLDAETNMWNSVDSATEITSNTGTKARVFVGNLLEKTTITKSEDVYCHVAFEEQEDSSFLWFGLYVRGLTSLTWEFSKNVNFYIECWSSHNGTITGTNGYLDSRGDFSGASGTADLSKANNANPIHYIEIEFYGDIVGVTEFDIISFEATYSVDSCLDSVQKNPKEY